ncbi:hypothetical protein ACFYXC_32185 [Streptomyces sp. NPDC002701]|uniref:hypothetical protein n=1 Tax=Streptomyces sp. NPDC002701 TaxID=3364661 RepID=UPI003697E5B7
MTGKAGEEGHIRPERDTDVSGTSGDGEPSATDEAAGGAPIFVDPSGRRAHRMRRVGWLVAAACVCSAATLGVVVADGNSTAPWLNIPGVLGSDDQARSTEVAPRPEPKASGAPDADGPSATATGPRAGTTTGTEAMNGARPHGNGTAAPSGEPSSAAPSSRAGETASAPAGGTEAAAGQPSGATSPEPAQEPSTTPGSAGPAPAETAPAPSPSASQTGLVDGLVDAVSGLFGR